MITIGASSALFLKKFSESIIATARRNDDPKNNSHGGDASTSTVRIITAEHIKQCIKERGNEYDFLKDVVFDGSDDDDQDQDEEKKKKKTATKRKKKSSVPNYSLLQHQKGGSTVDTSAAIQSEENDLVISGNNKNGEGKRASIISKTAKKQNKKIKLTNDDIGLNNYLKSTNLETCNNGRRFHDDDIIEDDEEYD